mgnify:CR=1 FL=1
MPRPRLAAALVFMLGLVSCLQSPTDNRSPLSDAKLLLQSRRVRRTAVATIVRVKSPRPIAPALLFNIGIAGGVAARERLPFRRAPIEPSPSRAYDAGGIQTHTAAR